MRVIAGRLGGRTFDSPAGHRTHPMSDKIRGALFNVLGDIEGLSVLDAFAGSGALSFEAISRGAAHVIAIDNDRRAQQVIATNNQSLGTKASIKLIRAGLGSWLDTTGDSFDIVLCDPPYDHVDDNLLARAAERAKPGGIVVLSLPPSEAITLPARFRALENKDYGDAALYFYRAG